MEPRAPVPAYVKIDTIWLRRPMPQLFSYGTLQLSSVQMATFGRRLSGTPDRLVGWREAQVEITDAEVLRRSRQTHHPVLVPGDGPVISGTVFDISEAELAQADAYEVSDYARVELELASGRTAWVYVSAAHAGGRSR